jgi:hypothetical protein
MTTATKRVLRHWHPLEKVLIKYEQNPPAGRITLKEIAAEANIPYNALSKHRYEELRNRALKITANKKVQASTRPKRSPEQMRMIANAVRLEAEAIANKGEMIKSLTDFLASFGLWMDVYKRSKAFDDIRPLIETLVKSPLTIKDIEGRNALAEAISNAKKSGQRFTLSGIAQLASFSDSRALRKPAFADLYIEAADLVCAIIPNREEVETRAKQALEDVACFMAAMPKPVELEDSNFDTDSGVDLSVCRIPAARKKMTWDEYWSYRTGRAL